MSSKLNFFLLALYSTFVFNNGEQFMETKADFLTTCESADSDFLACTTELTQQLYKQLKTGMDGLEDIEFDPIKLTQLQIVGDGGPISLNMTIDESVVKGYSTIVINTSEIVPSNQSWITSFYIPKILIEGYYRMHGRILVLPLVGSGNCSIEPSGINATAYMKTNFFENYGQIFYNVTEMTMDLHFSGMKLYLHNLFEGIKPLEEATNQALNDNWRELLDSFKTFVSKPIEDNFVFTFNKLLHYIPAKYIVSDIELPQVSTKN